MIRHLWRTAAVLAVAFIVLFIAAGTWFSSDKTGMFGVKTVSENGWSADTMWSITWAVFLAAIIVIIVAAVRAVIRRRRAA